MADGSELLDVTLPHNELKTIHESILQAIATRLDGDDGASLLDYVLVLVNNKRSRSKFIEDLDLFFGNSKAVDFTNWLFDFLRPYSNVVQETIQKADENEQKIAQPSITEKRRIPDSMDIELSQKEKPIKKTRVVSEKKKTSKRVLTLEPKKKQKRKLVADNAMDSAPSAPKKKKLELFTKKALAKMEGKPQGKMGKIVKTVKRTIVNPRAVAKHSVKPDAADESPIPTSPNLTNVVKCRFWPNCMKGDACPFFHPKALCKYWPNCSFGAKCVYIHPRPRRKQSQVQKCRYGSECMRADCQFWHPSKAAAGQDEGFQNSAQSQIPCRYDPNCTKVNCAFFHPQRDANEAKLKEVSIPT